MSRIPLWKQAVQPLTEAERNLIASGNQSEYVRELRQRDIAEKAAAQKIRDDLNATVRALQDAHVQVLRETAKIERDRVLTTNDTVDNKKYLEDAPSYMTEAFTEQQWTASCRIGLAAAKPIWQSANVRLPDATELESLLKWFVAQKPIPNPEDPNTWLTAMKRITVAGLRTFVPPPAVAPEPVAPPTASETVTAMIADLEKQESSLGAGREREAIGRKILMLNIQLELLTDPLFRSVINALCTEQQMSMSSATQLRLIDFIQQPKNSRRYDRTTEVGLRMAAADFFGNPALMNSEAADEVQYRRSVEGLTADQLKARLGSNSTFDAAGRYRGPGPGGV
jgi:hypothetical protein